MVPISLLNFCDQELLSNQVFRLGIYIEDTNQIDGLTN